MKKIISILLIACILSSLSVGNVFAEAATNDEVKSENLSVMERKQLAKLKLELYEEQEEIESTVSPCWSIKDKDHDNKNIHEEIINYAQKNSAGHIPDKYVDLVKSICTRCDKDWKGGGKTPLRAIHASGNYFANFKYMWYFTKKISKHTNGDSLAKDAQAADQYAYKRVGEPTGGDRLLVYDQMRDRIMKIITEEAGNVESGQTE